MKIIDAHIHFSNIESFKKTAERVSLLDYSSTGLKKEWDECHIAAGVAMGVTEKSTGGFPDIECNNPMGVDLDKKTPDNLFYCLGINPVKLEGRDGEKELLNIEKELVKSPVIGIKIYAGYYHYYVYDKIYQPIYEMAEAHGIPVVIHGGDTYSDRGLLKYSHPLTVDELAVSRRKVDFIIAHFGDPWIMDAAEIISKNPNVYGDLSGLIVGDESNIKRFTAERLFMDHIKRGLVYGDNYFKVIFGSDWPLVQLKPYIEFVKELVPEEFYRYVFYENATRVFKGLKNKVSQD